MAAGGLALAAAAPLGEFQFRRELGWFQSPRACWAQQQQAVSFQTAMGCGCGSTSGAWRRGRWQKQLEREEHFHQHLTCIRRLAFASQMTLQALDSSPTVPLSKLACFSRRVCSTISANSAACCGSDVSQRARKASSAASRSLEAAELASSWLLPGCCSLGAEPGAKSLLDMPICAISAPMLYEPRRM